MISPKDDDQPVDDRSDRDLIASMNEVNSFEELETLTRMARARLSRRGNDFSGNGSGAAQRLRRALARTPRV